MRAVYKYPLAVGHQKISAPKNWTPRHVAEQRRDLVLWAEVNTDLPLEEHLVSVYGTGVDLCGESKGYVGTILTHDDSTYVWHVYTD